MPKSFQVVAYELAHHVMALTEAGEFAGHQAARTVLLYFGHNIAVKNDKANGLQRGFVMEGCLNQRRIAQQTGLSPAAVSRAVAWLADEGFVRVRYRYEGQRQYTGSVEVTSYDEQSEAERQAWKASLAPKPRKRNHLKLVASG